MLLRLDDVLEIALQTEDKAVEQAWKNLFTGWLITDKANDPIVCRLHLQNKLPPLPSHPPYFTDDDGILAVYDAPNEGWLLHFWDGALVQVNVAEATISGVVTASALANGRLEDITFTSLAPLLRQRGYYLVHAFGATIEGHGVLIVGGSGSGKTTTGLNLLLHGWQLLSNDIVLLQERDDQVVALPTPGLVGIRPYTFTLLPTLKNWLPMAPATGRFEVAGDELVNGRYAPPTPIHTILFPQVAHANQLTPQNKAIALAHLLEESIDRWDDKTLAQHMSILQKLARQATCHQLLLGQDMTEQANLLIKAR